MSTQSAKTLSESEQVALSITLEELQVLIWSLNLYCSRAGRIGTDIAQNLANKIEFLKPNIGDACRHSVDIPEAPLQGGTTKSDNWVCPRCGSKTGVPLPKFSLCSECYGTKTPYPSEAPVQGGIHD